MLFRQLGYIDPVACLCRDAVFHALCIDLRRFGFNEDPFHPVPGLAGPLNDRAVSAFAIGAFDTEVDPCSLWRKSRIRPGPGAIEPVH